MAKNIFLKVKMEVQPMVSQLRRAMAGVAGRAVPMANGSYRDARTGRFTQPAPYGFSGMSLAGRGLMGVQSMSGRVKTAMNDMFGGPTDKKKFKFEYLGLMFAAMALSRALNGLLRPALEATGIFELINTTLLILFLPVILLLLPYLIKILKFFMGLSNETKVMIGSFVVLGAIVAGLVLAFSQAVLAVASLAIIFTSGFTAFTILIKVVLVLVAVAITLAVAFGIIGGYVSGLAKLLMGVVGGAAVGSAIGFGPAGAVVGGITGGLYAAGGMALGAFAEGGMVDRPTIALLGESGPEMVVPMNNFDTSFDISASMSSELDVDVLARKIMTLMVENRDYHLGR